MSLILAKPAGQKLILKKDSVAATDTNIREVSLLLHGNGANGSTTIADSSLNPKTVTAVGNAQISTAQSKFGGSSIAFDGTGDYLTIPQSSSFEFPGSFTIECWAWLVSLPSAYNAFIESLNFNNEDAQWHFGVSNDNKLLFYYHYPSRGVTNSSSKSAATLVTGQWNHSAVSRDASGSGRLFINGAQDGSFTEAGQFVNIQPNPYQVGRSKIGGSYSLGLNAYIDDLRITKGVARYTANFTPPTAPFPDF